MNQAIHLACSALLLSSVTLSADSANCEIGDEIVVGMINPRTGALASFGPSLEKATRLAFDQLNEHIEPHGVHLVLEVRDSATDVETSRQQATALIELGAVAIIGAAGSANSIAVSEVTIASGVLQISGASSSPAISQLDDRDLVFRTISSDSFQGEVLADEIWNDGVRRIAIVYLDNAYGESLANILEASFQGNVVGRISYPENVEISSEKLTLTLRQVYSTGPEAIVLVAYAEDGARWLSEWQPSAFDGSWYLTDGTKSEELAERVGAQKMEGIKGTAPSFVGGPQGNAFRQTYRARYGEDPGLFADAYYDAAMLTGLALFKASMVPGGEARVFLCEVSDSRGLSLGPEDLQQMILRLATGEPIDYVGASGAVDFDRNGDVAGDVEIWQFESGRPVVAQVVTR